MGGKHFEDVQYKEGLVDLVYLQLHAKRLIPAVQYACTNYRLNCTYVDNV